MSSKNLEKIEISSAREIHVQVSEYKGRNELDVRTFLKTENYTGYTPKGVRIPIERGTQVADAIITVLKREMPDE